MKKQTTEIQWLDDAEEHNYPAAQSYLSLIFAEPAVKKYVRKLRLARTSLFKSKDVFRASGLSLLGISNSHVRRDQQKIRAGEKLSPILLVKDLPNRKVIVADGYHRLCAVYTFDEDAIVPCKIVS